MQRLTMALPCVYVLRPPGPGQRARVPRPRMRMLRTFLCRMAHGVCAEQGSRCEDAGGCLGSSVQGWQTPKRTPAGPLLASGSRGGRAGLGQGSPASGLAPLTSLDACALVALRRPGGRLARAGCNLQRPGTL